MKMHSRKLMNLMVALLPLATLAVPFSVCGCRQRSASPVHASFEALPMPSDWSNPAHWFSDVPDPGTNRVDVFYVASTDVIDSHDASGNDSPRAVLTPGESRAIKEEGAWFRSEIFTREFNFFAPVYHQVTFSHLGNPRGGRNALWDAAAEEVCGAFDHYMAHENRGRRFILAGFSQGASVIRALLRHMTAEQYSRMVVAYAIGFQVTAEDLAHPHVRPARGADDTGVIVSFNSVASLDGRWDLVSGDAACSINPANWRTDATPAVFDLDGQRVTAVLDPTNHVVLVSGFAPGKTAFSHLFPEGNLHPYDRTLYARQIRENALRRSGSRLQ